MLDLISTFLNIFQGFILVKIAFLIFSGIYIVFLFVVYKQAKAMNRVIDDAPVSSILNNLALFNIFVGISIFVAAFVIM